MTTRAEAYVDTSAFIAFADRSDTHHDAFRRLFSEPPSLLTTTLVVAEGHGWFLRRYDHARALQFLEMLEAMTPLTVAPVGLQEQAAAAELLRRFSDQDLTIADALGLHLMDVHRIQACWSSDFHLGITACRSWSASADGTLTHAASLCAPCLVFSRCRKRVARDMGRLRPGRHDPGRSERRRTMDDATPMIEPARSALLMMDYQRAMVGSIAEPDGLLARAAAAIATAAPRACRSATCA